MTIQLRIARPVSSFERSLAMYRDGLGPRELERFLVEWQRLCNNMLAAGFAEVSSFNPYWQRRGRTFADPDGYRVVLQQAAWGGS